MNTITYAKLTAENFAEYSLDLFKRYQNVTQSLRNVNGQYVYVDNPFYEDWDLEKCRSVAKDAIYAINTGAIAYGAFYNNRVVGFAYLGTDYFGSKNQYIANAWDQESFGQQIDIVKYGSEIIVSHICT